MNRACHLQTKSETRCMKSKRVMIKSFISKNIEPNSHTKTSFLSEINNYTHIYQYANLVSRLYDNRVL